MSSDRNKIIQDFFESIGLMQRTMLAHKDRFLHQLGLNRPQMEALFCISRTAPTIKELSSTLNVTSSATTQMVEGLVQQGYVSREEEKGDRRIVRVVLTDEGRTELKKFREKIIKHITPRLEALSNEELITFTEVAKKVATPATTK